MCMQVRQGGMLGIKYTLAVCAASTPGMAERALPVLMAAMGDGDDDVRAAAVHACVPLAHDIAAQPAETVRGICDRLWALLPSFDEVSPAPASVMQLLGLLCSLPRTVIAAGQGSCVGHGGRASPKEDEAENTVQELLGTKGECEDDKPDRMALDEAAAMHGVEVTLPGEVDLVREAEVCCL